MDIILQRDTLRHSGGGCLSILGIQAGWASDNPYINNPMWYVSVLLLCYAIFWFLTDFARRKQKDEYKLYFLMILVGVAQCTVFAKLDIELPFLNTYSSRGYCAFFTGVILAKYNSNRNKKIDALCYVLLILSVFGIYFYTGRYSALVTRFLFTFFTAPGIILAVEKLKITSQGVPGKVISFVSESSFDAFVTHSTIYMIMMSLDKGLALNINFNYQLVMVTMAIIIMTLSIILHYFVEERINRKAEKALQYLFF